MTNTDTRAAVQRAKSALADAEAALLSAVKQGIKDGLIEAFKDPNVQNVAFGVSTQPYNDENMGCGTYGPIANCLGEDGELSEYHALYDLFSYRSDNAGSTREVTLLHDVINTASWENVGPALGLSTAEGESYGGQEVLFVAERSETAPGGYLLTQHDQGY